MADGIDLREFRKLRKDLHDFKPDRQLKKALKLAGALIVDDAKRRVSPYSQTVPPTIRLRVSKTVLTVYAGNESTPMGVLLEMGNKRRSSTGHISFRTPQGKKFNHPVFGDRENWVEQPMHPYLDAAAKGNAHAIQAFEGAIVAEAFREVGWKGS